MSFSETFDLLVVGGGVNGAGIARDAAGRGLKVMLIEQDSLARHTSSASSKLIHGGLRYLEHYEFRLVREALRERDRLLGIAPHLVQAARFVLPHVHQVRPAWMVRIGLFLYDSLAERRLLARSEGVKFNASPVGIPLRSTLSRGFIYSDCTVDDSRLVILNVKDAAERGAVVRIGHRFVSAERSRGVWQAQITRVADRHSYAVTARAIVNATGPWVSSAAWENFESASRFSTRLVKGSHIVVPKLYEGDQCYVLQNADRRIVFVIPYQDDFTLIGTTDVAWDADPGPVDIDTDEVNYLCATVNDYFKQSLSAAQVVWSYAGLRPLCEDNESDVSSLSRDYVLDVDAPQGGAPLLSVYGGKITTYRCLAEHALLKLQPYFGQLRGSWTGSTPLPGGDLPADVNALCSDVERRWPFLGPHRARRMARAYGTRIANVIGNARSEEDLGENFGAGLSRTEVDYLVREEWAQSAEDILWRHSKLGLRCTPREIQRLTEYVRQLSANRDASVVANGR